MADGEQEMEIHSRFIRLFESKTHLSVEKSILKKYLTTYARAYGVDWS